MKRREELEAALGHAFGDPALLERALTHASANADRSNERLEFLGDRVLGLVVAEALVERHPFASEGELASRLNRLVRAESCAEAARRIGLDAHLVLAIGERQTGGARKTAILGDACEAVIAALYLDGGFEAARRFVLSAWTPLFEANADAPREPKTTLQEWAQARPEHGRALPTYRIIERTGPDHAPRFVVEVEAKGVGTATGQGASRREAEQAAASALLVRIEGGA